jgi:hypothetical protein
MADCHSIPRALFLFPNEEAKPDDEICSGQYPSILNGEPCPYSDSGRIPLFCMIEGESKGNKEKRDTNKKQQASCILQELGRLDQWGKEYPLVFPKVLKHKSLYKCRQMFFVVLLKGY